MVKYFCRAYYLTFFILTTLLVACKSETTAVPGPLPSRTNPPATTRPVSPLATPSSTLTPAPPTPTQTPVPLAALVAGVPITLSDYEAHLARFTDAQEEIGAVLTAEQARQWVLDDLIDQTMLAQAAGEASFIVDDQLLAERIAKLNTDIGGEEALENWQSTHHYTDASFRRDLAQTIAATWMREQIVNTISEATEQVHARQILLYNRENANDALDQLQAGTDFSQLARVYDPQGLGDLGWFPRGYLTEPEIEAAAFTLEPGEISSIIETQLGFHIIQVLEKRSDRPLDSDALLVLQADTLRSWLQERRNQIEIEVFIFETP